MRIFLFFLTIIPINLVYKIQIYSVFAYRALINRLQFFSGFSMI